MDLIKSIEKYKEATEQFIFTISKLSEAELDTGKNQGWNARQVIHHLADSEAQSYTRLRRLIVEPGTQIQGYDQPAWGKNETLGYDELPIQVSVDVFRATRASSLEILKRLTVAQLENSGTHSEWGEYSIHTWLKLYINHPMEHAAQIRSGF
jgi:hypothetical protein